MNIYNIFWYATFIFRIIQSNLRRITTHDRVIFRWPIWQSMICLWIEYLVYFVYIYTKSLCSYTLLIETEDADDCFLKLPVSPELREQVPVSVSKLDEGNWETEPPKHSSVVEFALFLLCPITSEFFFCRNWITLSVRTLRRTICCSTSEFERWRRWHVRNRSKRDVKAGKIYE